MIVWGTNGSEWGETPKECTVILRDEGTNTDKGWYDMKCGELNPTSDDVVHLGSMAE